MHEFTVTKCTGTEHLTYTYQYANGVPLKDGEDALLVNWAQLTITNEEGAVTFRNSFVSNHKITKGLCRCLYSSRKNSLENRKRKQQYINSYSAKILASIPLIQPKMRIADSIFKQLKSPA